MKIKSSNSIILAAVLILLMISGVAFAAIEDTIKETFEVGEGGTLRIDTELGSIEVNVQRGNMVDIEITQTVKVRSEEDANKIMNEFDIKLSQDGKDVVVIAKFEDAGWDFLKRIRRKLKVHFVITVPSKYNVDLKTSGGSISVDDLEGKVSSETSGGSLKFGSILGPVNGRTSGGSIRLNSCSGDVDLSTSGGGIDIGEVGGKIGARTSGGSIKIRKAGESVSARTSGGSVSVEEVMGAIEAETAGGSITARISRQPEGASRLETSGGSVNVYLAEDIKADVNARTSGGRVSAELPVTIQGEFKKDELRAKINGGGPELFLRTSGGNINLRKL